MLKVSNKGRYAVRALFDLAFNANDQPAQMREIAERQRIPLRFLEQIFQDLKRARLVDSKRGPRGGYLLARRPEQIRVGDVLRALDGPLALLGEPNANVKVPSANAKKPSVPARRSRKPEVDLHQVTEAVFRELAHSVERCFDAVTLAHLCARGEQLGLRRRARPLSTSYFI